MGFYIRKSLQAGPFRVNLSKSGLGVSVGIKGFRIGTGPRGNYVHIGRGGVYYRASFNGNLGRRPRTKAGDQLVFQPSDALVEDLAGTVPMSLEPTAPDDVVDQLNEVSGKLLFRESNKVVIFYDVNDENANWFGALVEAWKSMAASRNVWRVTQRQTITSPHEQKMHAGSGALIQRVTAQVSMSGPRHLSTNIEIPSLETSSDGIYFLPERVLVRNGRRYSTVPYVDLAVTHAYVDFVEHGRPPSDSVQVRTTWKSVNKDGTPDRRVADNRRLPVLRYGVLNISTAGGLQWVIHTSAADAAAGLASVLESATGNLARATAQTAPDQPGRNLITCQFHGWSPGLPVESRFQVGDRVECWTEETYFGSGIIDSASIIRWIGSGSPMSPRFHVFFDHDAAHRNSGDSWFAETSLRRSASTEMFSEFKLGNRVQCLSSVEIPCQLGTIAVVSLGESGLEFHVLLDEHGEPDTSNTGPAWANWRIRKIPTSALRFLGGQPNPSIPGEITSLRALMPKRHCFEPGDEVVCTPNGIGTVQMASIHWEYNASPDAPTYLVQTDQLASDGSPIALWLPEDSLTRVSKTPYHFGFDIGGKVECRNESGAVEGAGIIVSKLLFHINGEPSPFFHVLIDPTTTQPPGAEANWVTWPFNIYPPFCLSSIDTQ